MDLTGQDLKYLYVCHRKLWLFRHGIRPEMENENVKLGMLLENQYFSREEKNIVIGDQGVLDWAELEDGVIHETKKGKSCVESDKAQVRFYMSLLQQHGIRIERAVIHYPSHRETLAVDWNEMASEQCSKDCAVCRNIIQGKIPSAVRKKICKKCAYEDICFI